MFSTKTFTEKNDSHARSRMKWGGGKKVLTHLTHSEVTFNRPERSKKKISASLLKVQNLNFFKTHQETIILILPRSIFGFCLLYFLGFSLDAPSEHFHFIIWCSRISLFSASSTDAQPLKKKSGGNKLFSKKKINLFQSHHWGFFFLVIEINFEMRK